MSAKNKTSGIGSVIRVCHLIPSLEPGGAEVMLKRLVLGMDQKRFSHRIICLSRRGAIGRELQQAGVRVEPLGFNRNWPNPLLFLKLVRMIRGYDPDLIQAWMYHANLLGSLGSVLTSNTKLVWALHASNFKIAGTRIPTRMAARAGAVLSHCSPDEIISVSRTGRDFHERMGYDTNRLRVIPNGFDTEEYCPDSGLEQDMRRELDLPTDAFVIGHVARDDPHKDHENFITAVAEVLETRPETRIVMCGDGIDEDNERLDRMIRATGYEDKFYRLGHRDDMPRVMNLFDVGVSSSRTEAFPLAVGEMMACGVPCVVTDVGDSAWLAEEGGIVVPPGDSGALKDGILELFDDPDKQNTLGERARRRIEREFSLESVLTLYSQLYEGLIRPRR